MNWRASTGSRGRVGGAVISNGSVIGLTKVVDNGPGSRRYNLLILAEGYPECQLPDFTRCVEFVAVLQATPSYGANWVAINVYRIDVASRIAGYRSHRMWGHGRSPATYFDASFCNGGIQRLLEVNDTTVHTVVKRLPAHGPGDHGAAQQRHLRRLKDPRARRYRRVSTNIESMQISLYEFGHIFSLDDEYPTWAGCGSAESGHNTYTWGPTQPSVTANNDWTALK
jgi:hypothetical protein